MENKYCGNCYYFSNEDIGGEGLCGYPLSPFVTSCGKKGCKHHTFRKPANNGWTEITPDNESFLTDELISRAVIGWFDSKNRWTIVAFADCAMGIGIMAKMGGYYYFVLPELRKEERI